MSLTPHVHLAPMKRIAQNQTAGKLTATPRNCTRSSGFSLGSRLIPKYFSLSASRQRLPFIISKFPPTQPPKIPTATFGIKRPVPVRAPAEIMSSLPTLDPRILKPLYQYTACDVSDALLKLKVPGAGYLADINLLTSHPGVVIAPASTVLFASKTGDKSSYGEANIPFSTHWVDLTTPNTIVVLSQPPDQKNAVCGGIMALRMKVLNAKGIVVSGRVRDLGELKMTGLPIFAKGVSTVGTGAETTPWALNVPVTIGDVRVNAGDIVFCDSVNGVVVIPREKIEEVVELIPRITAADDKIIVDVGKGMSVREAFNLHRGGY